jgi:hypothetical protein
MHGLNPVRLLTEVTGPGHVPARYPNILDRRKKNKDENQTDRQTDQSKNVARESPICPIGRRESALDDAEDRSLVCCSKYIEERNQIDYCPIV